MSGFNNLQEVGKPLAIKDEGITIIPSADEIDFVGAGITGSATGDAAVETIPGGAGTDELVKYDAGDPTAGYVADKIVAGTGISVAEGTAGDENKLVVTNSDPDQTVSITAGTNIDSITGTYPDFTVNAATQAGGDLSGPASATADNVAVFDGVTGKLVKDGGSKISDLAPALGADDNYVTNAEKTVIGNTSGANSGDSATPAETPTTLGATIGGADNATPNDTDFVATSLTAAGILKKITWTNVKVFLKTYFDTLYAATLGADDNYVTNAEKTVIGNTSNTNTGDEIVATGAEVDTGTDDVKYASAKALKDSHNVGSVAPSTDGNVMTSNGTDWVSETPAATVVKATGAELDTGTDDAKFATAKALADSDYTKSALPLAGGTMTGDIQLGETDIKLDAVLSADEKWSGVTMAGTAGATLAVGDVCFLQTADSKWELVDGILDGTDLGFKLQLGICVLAANADAATEMLVYGKIRSAAFPAFTVGAPVYLDDTAGDLNATQPSTTNFAIRIVGYATTAEDLLFNPENSYIIHI